MSFIRRDVSRMYAEDSPQYSKMSSNELNCNENLPPIIIKDADETGLKLSCMRPHTHSVLLMPFHNTVKPVHNDHPWDQKKWSLSRSGCYSEGQNKFF